MIAMNHPHHGTLDNPAWSALATKHAHLRLGGEIAVRYHPDVSPFAGLANTTVEALRQLGRLVPPGEHVLLQTLAPLPPMEGMHAENLFAVRQMVDQGEPRSATEDGVIRLSASDTRAMMKLALETKPGPFGVRTYETGNYIGIRDAGHLIAMAGERMQWDGYTEISAVCVNENYRGRGIAGRLMNILRHEIRQRGATPLLHVRDDNSTAIRLYEHLGFETRQTFHLYRVGF